MCFWFRFLWQNRFHIATLLFTHFGTIITKNWWITWTPRKSMTLFMDPHGESNLPWTLSGEGVGEWRRSIIHGFSRKEAVWRIFETVSQIFGGEGLWIWEFGFGLGFGSKEWGVYKWGSCLNKWRPRLDTGGSAPTCCRVVSRSALRGSAPPHGIHRMILATRELIIRSWLRDKMDHKMWFKRERIHVQILAKKNHNASKNIKREKSPGNEERKKNWIKNDILSESRRSKMP